MTKQEEINELKAKLQELEARPTEHLLQKAKEDINLLCTMIEGLSYRGRFDESERTYHKEKINEITQKWGL